MSPKYITHSDEKEYSNIINSSKDYTLSSIELLVSLKSDIKHLTEELKEIKKDIKKSVERVSELENLITKHQSIIENTVKTVTAHSSEITKLKDSILDIERKITIVELHDKEIKKLNDEVKYIRKEFKEIELTIKEIDHNVKNLINARSVYGEIVKSIIIFVIISALSAFGVMIMKHASIFEGN